MWFTSTSSYHTDQRAFCCIIFLLSLIFLNLTFLIILFKMCCLSLNGRDLICSLFRCCCFYGIEGCKYSFLQQPCHITSRTLRQNLLTLCKVHRQTSWIRGWKSFFNCKNHIQSNNFGCDHIVYLHLHENHNVKTWPSVAEERFRCFNWAEIAALNINTS